LNTKEKKQNKETKGKWIEYDPQKTLDKDQIKTKKMLKQWAENEEDE